MRLTDDLHEKEEQNLEREAAARPGLDDLQRAIHRAGSDQPKGERHLVPGAVFERVDRLIASRKAIRGSRLQEGKVYQPEKIAHILKGDAGEGYTYTRLLERYEPERILIQPDSSDGRNPDFAVVSGEGPDRWKAVVDAKAWSLRRPKSMGEEEYGRWLLNRPRPERLIAMENLEQVVRSYSRIPELEDGGRVMLFFPDEVLRYTPQIGEEVEGWSLSDDIVGGKIVEVRSMGVDTDALQEMVKERGYEVYR